MKFRNAGHADLLTKLKKVSRKKVFSLRCTEIFFKGSTAFFILLVGTLNFVNLSTSPEPFLGVPISFTVYKSLILVAQLLLNKASSPST
jgi:hypothetical protein